MLELSLREALQLSHNYIGTEHILLGLIREGEGVAAQVLRALGVDLPQARQRVIDLLPGDESSPGTATEAVPLSAGDAVPRCGRCGAGLAESARYRSIDVAPSETDAGGDPVRFTVIYCSRCGSALGSAGSPADF